jgi:hypothetical protein
MAIERVQSPFAASKRSIKRLEEKARLARRKEDREGRREYERLGIAKRAETRKSAAAANQALAEERTNQFKADLLESIRLNKPSGMFARKRPSINKVVVHTGKEGVDYEPSINEGHLRDLAAKSNALNMLVTGQAQADEQAKASLAPDFYPADYFQGAASEQHFGQATMPDQITPPQFPPDQTQVPPFEGQLPQDLDLTNLYQGEEFVGEEEPPAQMKHLFKMIDMFQAFEGKNAPKPSTTEEKVANIRSAGGGNMEVLRALGALEKPGAGGAGDESTKLINDILAKANLPQRSREILKSTKQGRAGGTGGRAKPKATEEEANIERIRADFMENTGLEPSNIEVENGTIVVYVGNRKFVVSQ